MLRGQDVDLCQAKIMIDLLVRGIGIDQREPNRVFFVFVYPGVKGRDITVFDALSPSLALAYKETAPVLPP